MFVFKFDLILFSRAAKSEEEASVAFKHLPPTRDCVFLFLVVK